MVSSSWPLRVVGRVLVFFSALVFVSAGPVAVAAPLLTAEACREITEKYGVAPQNCAQEIGHNRWSGPTDMGLEIQENHVFFAKGGAVLDGGAAAQIALLAKVMNTGLMRRACLRLIGHSDTSGGAQANATLALKRARAVQAELAKLIVGPDRITGVETRGEEAPLPGVKGTSPWQRRVEIQARDCL